MTLYRTWLKGTAEPGKGRRPAVDGTGHSRCRSAAVGTWISLALVAAAFALQATSPAAAQDLQGFQLFAPAEVSPYDNGPDPHTGYFFSYEGLYWNIQGPDIALVGSPNDRLAATHAFITVGDSYGTNTYIQHSDVTTSGLAARFDAGQRIEFGRVAGDMGWMVSITDLRDQYLHQTVNGPVDVVFDDPDNLEFGLIGVVPTTPPVRVEDFLPMAFDSLEIQNRVTTWSVEADMIKRSQRLHNGGFAELFLGGRYMEFDDRFSVIGHGTISDATAAATLVPITGALADSNWTMETQNHIVGPQIGLRYFHQHVRWMLDVQGRFMAGLNAQSMRGRGQFASLVTPAGRLQPDAWDGSNFDERQYFREFTPLVELRVQANYVLTRSITFTVGWTGIWMDNIVRASNGLIYEIPAMGIDTGHRNRDLLMQGLTMGIQVNR